MKLKRAGNWQIVLKASSLDSIRGAGVASLFAAALALAGCGSGSFHSTPSPPSQSSSAVEGTVMGGQQPVSGSEVRLYAAGSSGYGVGAKTLLSAAYTDQSGNFSLTGKYTCPSGNPLTYVTATSGDPGTGKTNPAISLMAVLGPCNQLDSVTTIVINEVTTVAAVWTMAPFLGAGGLLGTSAANSQGLLNAYAGMNNLAVVATGTAPGSSTPSGAVIPTAKINTLANILAACVNSAGATVCGSLFSASTPAGGSAPDNTLDAALNIARNPGAHVAALYAIPAPTAPFQPVLTSAPPDWTIALTFKGGGLDEPGSIAIDSSGNVWAANYWHSVSEFSNSGQALSPSTGFTGGGLNESYGIAIDQAGSVWVTNQQSSGVNGGHGTLTVLNSSGSIVSGQNGYFAGGVYFPVAIAGDTDGSVWSANNGNSTASRLSSTGSSLSGTSGFGFNSLEGPVAVAVDASHNAWFTNQAVSPGSVTSISPDGSKVNTVVCCEDILTGIATDAVGVAAGTSKGHVWAANYHSGTVSELQLNNNGSTTVVSAGYSGGGLNHPNSVAVDGASGVWVTNFDGNSITELQGASSSHPGQAVSSSSGFGSDVGLVQPYGIAIDASGNVWVSSAGANTITEFVGAAAPVGTPLLGPAKLP